VGPLEYIAIGFAGNHFTGEIMPQIEAIRDQPEVVRILDLVFVSRDEEGHRTTMNLSDLPDEARDRLSSLEGSTSFWFTEDDIDKIGDEIPDNSSVALILLEHVWAKALQQSIERANGQLIGEGFIPRLVVDQIEAQMTAGV
jgi:hypothetical protein